LEVKEMELPNIDEQQNNDDVLKEMNSESDYTEEYLKMVLQWHRNIHLKKCKWMLMPKLGQSRSCEL
jgi:hypothetical protein